MPCGMPCGSRNFLQGIQVNTGVWNRCPDIWLRESSCGKGNAMLLKAALGRASTQKALWPPRIGQSLTAKRASFRKKSVATTSQHTTVALAKMEFCFGDSEQGVRKREITALQLGASQLEESFILGFWSLGLNSQPFSKASSGTNKTKGIEQRKRNQQTQTSGFFVIRRNTNRMSACVWFHDPGCWQKLRVSTTKAPAPLDS